jgi:hypothetical protein
MSGLINKVKEVAQNHGSGNNANASTGATDPNAAGGQPQVSGMDGKINSSESFISSSLL